MHIKYHTKICRWYLLVVILKIDIKYTFLFRFHIFSSGIACVAILKYTLILSLQFTKSTENKTSKQKESQIILEINSLDM
jgi:hypothetical protein